MGLDCFEEWVCVITFIGNQRLRLEPANQSCRLRAVMALNSLHGAKPR